MISSGLVKCSKIQCTVLLRQMVRRWRQKAASRRSVPSDVPAGHVAVTVGSSGRRFIVRAAHLNQPIFRRLLVQTEEEYGFGNQCAGDSTGEGEAEKDVLDKYLIR